jgi:hypothetical protein
MNDSLEGFFTKKHKRLSWIATISGIFSWVVLLIFSASTIVNLADFFDYIGMSSLPELFRTMPVLTMSVISRFITPAFRGLVYFLLLRGLKFGLNMIIETDLNYREDRDE